MLVVADIAIGGSEFKGNIFIGSEDTPCTVNRSVGLVVCGKCENKRVIGRKICELVLRQNGRCKCGGVDVVGCEVCVSNIIRFRGGEVCVMIEDTFLHVSGHISNTISVYHGLPETRGVSETGHAGTGTVLDFGTP